MIAARRQFAEEVIAVAGIDSPRLLEAFARVPREDFLGAGPWEIVVLRANGQPSYRRTPDADPRHLSHNVIVAIDRSRNLNNGHPSSLASWIHELQIAPSDSVLHVGCGTGYYSAILADMAAQVTAIEVDSSLATAARANLVRWPNVRVFEGDGSETHGTYDAILINAGATHPRVEWLDALRPGGRLLVPITVAVPQSPIQMRGTSPGMMLFSRDGEASFIGPVQIYDCAGTRDPALEPVLLKALFGGRFRDVHKLRRDAHPPGPECVVHGTGWCLASG